MRPSIAQALGRALIVTLAVGALPVGAGAAGSSQVSDETYTTVPFRIVGENVSRVRSVETDGGVLVVTAAVGACTGNASGTMIRLRVHGATPGAFHEGELIATGASLINHKLTPSIRTVSDADLKTLGCSAQ